MSDEPTGDALVRPIIDAILSGEAHWVSAAPLFWCDDADDERLIDVVHMLELASCNYDAMTSPDNPNYPWCKGEWTAEMDANVVAEIRAMLEAA